MLILFLNAEEPVTGKVKKISENVVEITGVEQNLSGFHLVRNSGIVYGKYDSYTTLYRTIENGFQLSDDGSVYVEPEPEPEPEPYEPTLEDVQETKVAEMNTEQQNTIEYGVDVMLTDGTSEHFSLTQYDQQSLMGLQTLVDAGQENIPWHNSDETEHCKFYSNADMALIIASALAHVTYHVTYFRDLRIYVRALDSKEEVQAITYGVAIPEKYQSEVLKVLSTQTGGAS